jgi:hypothetical protein
MGVARRENLFMPDLSLNSLERSATAGGEQMKSIRAMAYCSQRASGHKITLMRPIAFGEALPAGTRLTLFSDDKPDRFFTVIKFWMDAASGVVLDLKTGVPTYQVRRRGRQNSSTHSPANRVRRGRAIVSLTSGSRWL